MKILFFVLLLSTYIVAQSGNSLENKNVSDSCKNTSYSLGAVLGDIFIANPKIVVSNLFTNIDLQFMAMYGFKGYYQTELDINYTVFRSGNMSHSFGAGGGLCKSVASSSKSILGFSGDDRVSRSSRYVKLNYSLMWNWFFCQLGFAIGSNNYSGGKPVLRLGYLYRF